ncbi:MAG: anthranilate phosphoribosyltransferase [Miltoncostaeaceae bacterium]
MTPDPVLTECLEVLVDGGDLSRTQAERAVGVMMDGAAGEVQMAAFLTALRAKGVTAVELAGLAQAVRDRAAHVPVDDVHGLVDTCGTGGGPPTVNVSTGAAFIAAAAGARVAKHGNRAVTSSSGSADVLEALGARVDLAPEAVATCIAQVGVGFMFAPAHHPAFRHVGPVRRELGIRTAFNLIGPLANPAGARNQVVGVYDRAQVEVVAEALSLLGARRALVVAGRDGLDEISTGAPTDAVLWEHDGFSSIVIDPAALGITPPPADALEVGDAAASATLLRAAIGGDAGPVRDILVVNAGAAVWMADLAHSLEKGMEMAEEAVRSGAARERLEGFVALTNDLAPGEEGS